MENKRGFHITIVENKTGETLDEFDTKGMVYVHLAEVDEEGLSEDEKGAVTKNRIGAGQKMEDVNPFEQLSLLEGLQILMEEMQEDNPALQLLMAITNSKRKPIERD